MDQALFLRKTKEDRSWWLVSLLQQGSCVSTMYELENYVANAIYESIDKALRV